MNSKKIIDLIRMMIKKFTLLSQSQAYHLMNKKINKNKKETQNFQFQSAFRYKNNLKSYYFQMVMSVQTKCKVPHLSRSYCLLRFLTMIFFKSQSRYKLTMNNSRTNNNKNKWRIYKTMIRFTITRLKKQTKKRMIFEKLLT